MSYDTSGFQFLSKTILPHTVEIRFINNIAIHKVFCFDNKVQYANSQHPEEPMSNGEIPTEAEAISHSSLEEQINSNHQPIQDWLDSLNIW